MEDEILDFLATEMDVAKEDLKIDTLKSAFKIVKSEDYSKLKASSTKVTQLEKQIEVLKEEKTSMEEKAKEEKANFDKITKEKAELEPIAKFGREVISAKREEAKRLYRLNKGTKADEAYIGIIEKADEKELNSILKEYGSQLTEKFTGVCKHCHSTEIDYRSTLTEESEGQPTEKKEKHILFSLLTR